MIRYKYNLNIDTDFPVGTLTTRRFCDVLAEAVASKTSSDYHAVSVNFEKTLDMGVVHAYPLTLFQALEKVLLEDVVVVGDKFLDYETLERSNRTVYLVRVHGGNTISQPVNISEEYASQKYKVCPKKPKS